MTFLELHAESCRECGQSEIMLRQVLLNDTLEREGREEFIQDNFGTCMERGITLYMPYYDSKNPVHVKYANLYGLTIANHRSEIHVEDRKDEIELYTGEILSGFKDGQERVEMAAKVWWAG